MIFSCPDGLIFSTDDYFAHRDGYCYDPRLLGEAHEWNQTRGCYTSSDLFIYSCYCSVWVDDSSRQRCFQAFMMICSRWIRAISTPFNHFNVDPLSAGKAMQQGRSPIIIDNTNIQAWEMKPYVSMVSIWFYTSVYRRWCKPPSHFWAGFGFWIQRRVLWAQHQLEVWTPRAWKVWFLKYDFY